MMSKEVNTEEKQTKNRINFIMILGIVVVIAIIIEAITSFKSDNNRIVQEHENTTTATDIEKEQTIARIDISTTLIDDGKMQFEVYADESEVPLEQADWMPKYNAQGNVVQKEGNSVNIIIKALNDSVIRISLKGPWKLNENGKQEEVWVKYTSLTIDGEEILPEPVNVWHDKTFAHTINTKAGEEYKIHAEWTKADK